MNEFVKNVNNGFLNLDDFCRGLILCHGTRTKLKNQEKKTDFNLSFDFILFEDSCILNFAKKCGYTFEANLIMNQKNCYKICIFDKIEYYQIMATNHSTRNRQRFSILFEKDPKLNGLSQGGLLYIRGSFKQMHNCMKLKNIEKDHLRNICGNLENMGYRVIIYAKKELKPEEMEECLRKFDMAKTNLTIDDEELENLYRSLEQNAIFLSLICVEEMMKPGIKPLVESFKKSRLKIGVFSADTLSKTLSVVYKAKIIDFSKEIMVLEGDSSEKILSGIQALLDHINKTIRKDLETSEEFKSPVSPLRLKDYFEDKTYSFNYFLMFHSSSIEIIYNNAYLFRHILFLSYF